MRDLRRWCFVVAWALAGIVAAHGLELFVATEGADVWGMAYFADGARARDVPVSLMIDDVAVAVVRTDADGRFRFVAPAPTTARVEALTLDGHRAVWELTADDWAGAPTSETERAALAEAAAAAAAPSAARVLLGVGGLLGLTLVTTVAWRRKRD